MTLYFATLFAMLAIAYASKISLFWAVMLLVAVHAHVLSLYAIKVK